jgi:hypothetical protein
MVLGIIGLIAAEKKKSGASFALFGIQSHGTAVVYLDPFACFPSVNIFCAEPQKHPEIKLKIYNGIIHYLKQHQTYSALSKEECTCAQQVRKTADAVNDLLTCLESHKEAPEPAVTKTRFEFTLILKPTTRVSLQATINELVKCISSSFKDTPLCTSIVGCPPRKHYFRFLPFATWAAALPVWRRLLHASGLCLYPFGHRVSARAQAQLQFLQNYLGVTNTSITQKLNSRTIDQEDLWSEACDAEFHAIEELWNQEFTMKLYSAAEKRMYEKVQDLYTISLCMHMTIFPAV